LIEHEDGRKFYAEAEAKKWWKTDRFPFHDVNWMLDKVLKYRGNYEGKGLKTYYFLVNEDLTHVCCASFDKISAYGVNLGRRNSDNLALLTTKLWVPRFKPI
jgi:hypothetical protein